MLRTWCKFLDLSERQSLWVSVQCSFSASTPVPDTQEILGQVYWTNDELRQEFRGFPGGSVVKNTPANAGDMGSSPGPGKSHMLWSN